MNYQDKTREELITELLKLQQENRDLKLSRDLAERKIADNNLIESEEKFRSLYANMSEGSALHTIVNNDQGVPEDYRIIEVNPAFESQLGIIRETVINKTSRDAYGVDAPPYFEIYSRVALTGNPEVFETYFAPLDKYFSISVYCPFKGSFATIFEDISERKKAEQSLNTILAKYQVLFDIFPLGITISDAAGKILETNQIAETLLGLAREEQEKRKISGQEWRIIRPDGTTMPDSEFASVRALEEGRPVINVEMGIVKDDNQITWINVSAMPVPLEGYGVAIVYNDVTERKLAEQALKESEEKYRLLAENTKDVIWVLDPESMYLTYTSPSVESLLGYTSEELKTIPFGKLLIPEIREPFLQRTHERVESFLANPESDSGYQNEVVHLRKNGSSVWTEVVNQYYLNKSTGKVEIQGVSREITKRRKAEEELRKVNDYLENLINYANAPIIVWDPQFRITRFNHAFENLTGRKEAEVIGESIELLFAPELVWNSMNLIRKTQTGERWETVEIQIQHRDKSVRTLLWNSATLFLTDGKSPVATIAQGSDITERKLAEEALKQSEARLKELNATKDKFFTIIAHDLIVPFNAILGFSSTLKTEAHDLDIDSILQYADIINSSAQNTYRLLENLLRWARMQQGGIPFEPKAILFNGLVKSEIENLKYNADQKNIKLFNDTKEELIITADEEMLRTVLRNLISNAIKFTYKGGKVSIDATRKIDQVEISVSDTGIGMKNEIIKKIFKIETSFTTRGTVNEKGSGLGLLLCKEFVEKHGGTIWAESETGKGSRFTFSIPYKAF